jgi:hypothetical protein
VFRIIKFATAHQYTNIIIQLLPGFVAAVRLPIFVSILGIDTGNTDVFGCAYGSNRWNVIQGKPATTF